MQVYPELKVKHLVLRSGLDNFARLHPQLVGVDVESTPELDSVLNHISLSMRILFCHFRRCRSHPAMWITALKVWRGAPAEMQEVAKVMHKVIPETVAQDHAVADLEPAVAVGQPVAADAQLADAVADVRPAVRAVGQPVAQADDAVADLPPAVAVGQPVAQDAQLADAVADVRPAVAHADHAAIAPDVHGVAEADFEEPDMAAGAPHVFFQVTILSTGLDPEC